MPKKTTPKSSYEIYLSGPNEKYTEIKYKTIIKLAFPKVTIYDTSDRPSGDWFKNDLQVLQTCKLMVFMTPHFPLPGVSPKIGYFYYSLQLRGIINFGEKSQQIICIWPPEITPKHGQRVVERMGIIVPTVEEAIKIIKMRVD